MKPNIANPPSAELFRSAPSRGIEKDAVDRTGGDKGAGIIRGFSVITLGEALGHDMWIDDEMLSAVENEINAGKVGLKSRFTHPGLSNDGLGSFLGRAKNARRDGDLVRADLHISPSAHDTPDGDLANYVMSLASEDPASFGTSIVFRRDRSEEEKHRIKNSSEEEGFVSPDKRNKRNLPHVRMKSLYAVDAVDEPAANPSGMFHKNDIPHEAESLLSFALGLTDERPELVTLSAVDPERAAGFVNRFLERHKLQISPKEEPMSATAEAKPADTKPAEVKTEPTAAEQLAQQKAEAELERRSQVLAVCKLAKVDDETKNLMLAAGFDGKRAQEFLAKSGHLSAANPPISEGGSDPTNKPAASKEEMFGKEWDAHSDLFERQGVERDEYIASRLKD